MNTERSPNATGSTPPPLPTDSVAILPVRNMVLFPGVIIPISIGREGSIAAAQFALRSESPLGILLQRDPTVDEPSPDDLYSMGTLAATLRYVTGPEGTHNIICQGQERFRILDFLPGYPFLVARIEHLEEEELQSPAIEARMLRLRDLMAEALDLMPQAPAELINALKQVGSATVLADLVASFMDLAATEKQEILEILDPRTRLDRVIDLLRHRLEVMRLSKEISEQTKQSMDDRQREFLLREQLKTIQRELGEAEEGGTEVADLRQAIAKARMPEEAESQALKELRRLERMPEASAEYSMVRGYLDWLVELPWSVETEDRLDLAEAQKVLDEDHFGLEKVKKRILEYLAIRKLNPGGKSPILCFVGPPGVGKTSLGQSIARAMQRKFVRVSLGGVHDEAEIRGHRRTYIGALPGNIIQSIRKAGSRNCIMMLDEIDKLGASFQGDPSAALLEVLDPEQNDSFRDNYLAVPFDLSRVMFITTANVLEAIPGPLRDRTEIIPLPGYTAEEKLQIARRYLVAKQRETSGLAPDQCTLSDGAIETIIRDYTREAGVRSLEREIGACLRHAAVRIAKGEIERLSIGTDDLQAILGPRRFENEVAMRTSVPGVATGLAWTPVGGDILFIEASRAPGSGKLILTGQLGEVMKESAQTALSLAKAHSGELHVDPGLFEKSDIHIHVPAGATPKDGPSAGVAMYVALVSLLTRQSARNDTAMTGEISLRGLVLPVGGIKEKVLAALASGISRVLLPARNRKELDEIPKEARDKLQFVWIEQADQALWETLRAAPGN